MVGLFSLLIDEFYVYFADNPIRHQPIRDVDDRSNSTLTESRHVSMQANVPTLGSLRVLPFVEGERSFEQLTATTTAFTRSASEHKK